MHRAQIWGSDQPWGDAAWEGSRVPCRVLGPPRDSPQLKHVAPRAGLAENPMGFPISFLLSSPKLF